MCGFAGFITTRGLSKSISEVLHGMASRIQHRGPDGSGTWYDTAQNVGLCHNRLAIVELSEAGHQPMQCEAQRFVLVFNGEIYNHLKLRAQLEFEGSLHQWKGQSDTETLLYCLSYWGVAKTLKSLIGMFAMAVWDCQEQVLTLARDRLGEKPLYWGWQDGVLLFGSELKALKAHPAFCADISRDALALYLRHNYVPAPYSIYDGIEKLMPGHYVNISVGQNRASVTPIPYWSFNTVVTSGLAAPLEGDTQGIINALEDQLTESIGMQMLADVPLGAFLSGGIDSSLIVALMQKQSQRPVKTFTIGFDEPGFNEAEHALSVSRHLGTEHTEIYVKPSDALGVIPDLPTIYCEPFADSSQIPTFLVSQLAKQHVTVALSGDAGDELFGGYNPYQFAPRIWDKVSKIPYPLRSLASIGLRKMPLRGKAEKLANIIDTKTREDFYRQLMSHWKRPLEVVINAREPSTLLTTPFEWPNTDSFESWMMAMDAQTYMVDDILVKVDRAAMANSLETRVPLLDHRVVELAWKIPTHLRIKNGKGKWPLREVLSRHVPKQMFERPKKGFSIPVGHWLRGPLREWAEVLLDRSRLQKEGYFKPEPIRKLWNDHLSGKGDYSSRLWGVLMFQAWLESN